MILVFQSVVLSSNRQNVFPPLEMVVQGLSVPGILATRQPTGRERDNSAKPLLLPYRNYKTVLSWRENHP